MGQSVGLKWTRGAKARSRLELTRHWLKYAFQVMTGHLDKPTLEEALFVPQGGYRSVLGTLKHAAGWSHVYRSYAFDPEPRHWNEIAWPNGLRDTVIKSQSYVNDVTAWFELSHQHWMDALSSLTDDQLDELRPLHWGAKAPLHDIVVMIAGHHIYHAGELNQVLSIYRGEAWEEGEEVEENNVSTIGHRVIPPWRQERGQ
jgi:hypothetical protein